MTEVWTTLTSRAPRDNARRMVSAEQKGWAGSWTKRRWGSRSADSGRGSTHCERARSATSGSSETMTTAAGGRTRRRLCAAQMTAGTPRMGERASRRRT